MKGQKMCKYENFEYVGLFDRMRGTPTIQCSNENVNVEWIEKVKQNRNKCCRRLCPYYKSR